MTWQNLSAMFEESYYMSLEERRAIKGEGENDDYEWMSIETFEGQKRIKRLKNPTSFT